MNKPIVFAALALAGAAAGAQEVGTVISTVPVIQQVAVPRTTCAPQAVVVEPQTSGGGGLIGAIAGAALGSQIGSGNGRIAATLIGTVGGAIVGNQIEAGGARRAQAQPECTTQTFHENRTVGYNVTYEYAGRQYTVQMPYDPGPTIRLQVTPVGLHDAPPAQTAPQAAVQGGPVVVAPPVVQTGTTYVPAPMAAPVVVPAPMYYPAPVVYQPYYRPVPVGISLNFGYGRHRHRH